MNDKLKWIALGSLALVVVIYASMSLRDGSRIPPAVPLPPRSEVHSKEGKSKSLRISVGSVDMGDVKVGEVRSQTATIENIGNESVSIERIAPSCECMSGETDSKVILPGRTAVLKVDIKGIPGRHSYVGTVSIITNESGPSRYDLEIRARVIQDLVVSPETVDFGTAGKKTVMMREVTVSHREHRAFQIIGVRSNRDELQFSWTPVEENSGGGYRIRCVFTATRAGIMTETMHIETNDPICPSLDAYLRAEVESEMTCSPPTLAAKVDQDLKACRFEASIEHKAHRSVKIESVREGQGRSVEFAKANLEGGGQKLEITLKESPSSGTLFGEFLVTVSGEPDPIIIPYRVEAPGGKVTEKP